MYVYTNRHSHLHTYRQFLCVFVHDVLRESYVHTLNFERFMFMFETFICLRDSYEIHILRDSYVHTYIWLYVYTNTHMNIFMYKYTPILPILQRYFCRLYLGFRPKERKQERKKKEKERKKERRDRSLHICICVNTHIYVYMCVNTHIYVYMYTHICLYV